MCLWGVGAHMACTPAVVVQLEVVRGLVRLADMSNIPVHVVTAPLVRQPAAMYMYPGCPV